MRVVCPSTVVRIIPLPNGEKSPCRQHRPTPLLLQPARARSRIQVSMVLPTKRNSSMEHIVSGSTLWVRLLVTIVLCRHGAKTLLAMTITTSAVLISITSARAFSNVISASTTHKATRPRPRIRQNRMIPATRADQM